MKRYLASLCAGFLLVLALGSPAFGANGLQAPAPAANGLVSTPEANGLVVTPQIPAMPLWAADSARVKNVGSTYTFYVCENAATSTTCSRNGRTYGLRPGYTTGWADTDGIICGEGYKLRVLYQAGTENPYWSLYDCWGSGVYGARMVKIPGDWGHIYDAYVYRG